MSDEELIETPRAVTMSRDIQVGDGSGLEISLRIDLKIKGLNKPARDFEIEDITPHP